MGHNNDWITSSLLRHRGSDLTGKLFIEEGDIIGVEGPLYGSY